MFLYGEEISVDATEKEDEVCVCVCGNLFDTCMYDTNDIRYPTTVNVFCCLVVYSTHVCMIRYSISNYVQ